MYHISNHKYCYYLSDSELIWAYHELLTHHEKHIRGNGLRHTDAITLVHAYYEAARRRGLTL